MAVKRVTNIHNKKYRTCLKCGRLLPANMKDDTKITCEHCHTEMFVDIYKNTLTLTAATHEYLRRRLTQEEKDQIEQIDPTTLEKIREQIKRESEAELEKAREEAESWKAAAEGLARQIEEMNARQ